jgi:glutathione S-transferase
MILIGRNLSPFVRRTAATLNLLGLAFEQRALSTVEHRETITGFNPLGRVPALVLEDGAVLVDSIAILDAIDDMVGPARALVPASGAARRQVLHAMALAVGTTEKVVAAYQELNRRPAELVWAAQGEKLLMQSAGGFAALDALAAAAEGGWLCGAALTQADVTATCALDFAEVVQPALVGGRFPALSALRDRANAIPAIGDTRWRA